MTTPDPSSRGRLPSEAFSFAQGQVPAADNSTARPGHPQLPPTAHPQLPGAIQPGMPKPLSPSALPVTPGAASHSVSNRRLSAGAAARPLPVKKLSPAQIREEQHDGDEEDEGERTPDVVKAAPPWLVSLVFHMVLLIVLGLLYIVNTGKRPVEVEIRIAEQLGEQLDDDSVMITADDPLDVEEQIITPENLPEVEDPLAAPPIQDITINGQTAMSELSAPAIGLALTGREKGMKRALLAAYGGNATTEKAVDDGLKWLQRNQLKNGLWSLAGPYSLGGVRENQAAATAMALLAFQGAGNTHKTGKYKAVVARGWNAFLKLQNKDGNFATGQVDPHHQLYAHGQAAIAICELYGMTKDPKYKDAAARALDYAYKAQAPEGGWRYYPGEDSDTSVTGWFVMALQSGRMAGLTVPSPNLARITSYLDSAAVSGGSEYAYKPGRQASITMTAEGLLCRQYLGWKQDDKRLVEGVKLINQQKIDWNEQDVYYWYYATQVTHHMEGDAWDQWNGVMREVLPRNQVQTGAERGSWSPRNDAWGARGGGRLFTTCLCVYMLEVYYRHLPIYAEVYKYKTQF